MQPPVLSAMRLGKRFPTGVQALVDVDLDVAPGETLVLIGESGCGKSTLLRMFNRLEEPSAGEVQIRGQRATDLDPIELRRQTGYVLQEGGLLPHWNVARNVELVPELLGWSATRRQQRRDTLLELVGLDPALYASRYAHELSGGQRQRVAFARAIAADPDVILLDEPFGALDALTRVELQEEFARLKARLQKTMLLVTHDLAEAFRLGDRIAVMRQGRILQCAPPRTLQRQPADAYVGELLAHAPEVPE
ncbi:MAG: ATP-binding cassette domain-containing protein [Candidatus Latescibacterota bacterium]|nr:MAG: ATP-binding cassette domain-containing protein [Candidatus Latescibacterota bacterium]